MKECRICKEIKSYSEFYKHNKRKDGYRSECKICHKLEVANWQTRNRDKCNGYIKKWKQTENGKISLKRYKRKRRQVHKNATPLWANNTKIDKIYKVAKARGLVVDHVVPLNSTIVCGLHCEDNLQPISWDENLRKNNRYWPNMP